jgi:hypothetical protein
MGSLGNLVVLKLQYIICMRPEDVEILEAIPGLLFLKLVTIRGTNGRITIHGRNGFRSLKYLYLGIYHCGTTLEFQVGSMPKLEHVKLMFPAHKRECLNGASDLGIQHLSALSKVEVRIWGNCRYVTNYNLTEDENDDAVRWVANAINGAIMTHPNRPTIRFETRHDKKCQHFECVSSLHELPALMIPSTSELLLQSHISFFHLLANTWLLSTQFLTSDTLLFVICFDFSSSF